MASRRINKTLTMCPLPVSLPYHDGAARDAGNCSSGGQAEGHALRTSTYIELAWQG